MRNLFDLTGRTALVTGASSGLGENAALVLAENGADVAVLARRTDRLEAVKAKIEGMGRRCVAVSCDVTAESNIVAAVKEIADFFSGRIDILINNAGVGGSYQSASHPTADWYRIIETNLNSVFFFAREVGALMIGNGYGKIVNMGSIHSNVAMKTLPITAYCTTKGGVQMMTKALAAEWAGSGITVNAIGPSYFESEMTASLVGDAGFESVIKTFCPMGRFGKASDLDGTILYLASDASPFTTGQLISVDGGWTAI